MFLMDLLNIFSFVNILFLIGNHTGIVHRIFYHNIGQRSSRSLVLEQIAMPAQKMCLKIAFLLETMTAYRAGKLSFPSAFVALMLDQGLTSTISFIAAGANVRCGQIPCDWNKEENSNRLLLMFLVFISFCHNIFSDYT